MYLAIREMRFAKVRYSLIAVIMLLVAFLVLFVTGLRGGSPMITRHRFKIWTPRIL
ncbi:hypothetical protein CM49_06213 [Paenibacillus sp. P1XP2]|nr:hypothetical protein CM49_06213 [Paenibacillus sp. P1XP2]